MQFADKVASTKARTPIKRKINSWYNKEIKTQNEECDTCRTKVITNWRGIGPKYDIYS